MDRRHGIDEERRVADEAALWLARLDRNDCSAADLHAFEHWRTATPLHDAAYRRAKNIWNASRSAICASSELREAAQQALHTSQGRDNSNRGWWAVLSAVAAVALAIMAIAHWPPFAQAPQALGERYVTAVGERRDVVLKDGSKLLLDTQTIALVRYSPQLRRIDLQQGQAQFEVQSDPERPFVVHAGNGTITAIGTRFQVRVIGTDTTVTLLNGVVRVAATTPDGSERVDALHAGQQIRFDADGHVRQVALADTSAVQGWTEGKLYVDDWSLRDFVMELNRYSTTQVRIDDPKLAELRISGVFQTDDHSKLQRLLSQGWGIHAQTIAPNQILLSRQ